jgi:hypothetical protein
MLTQAALYVGEGMTNTLAMTNKDPRIIIAFLNYLETLSPQPKIKWGTEVRVWWFFDCLSTVVRDKVLEILKIVKERHERTEMVNTILYYLKKDLYRKLDIPTKSQKVRVLNFKKIVQFKDQAVKLAQIINTHNGEWVNISKFYELQKEVLDRIRRNLDFSEGGITRPWITLSLSLDKILSKYQMIKPFVVPVGLNTDFQEGIDKKEYIGLRIRADSTLNELVGKCQTGPEVFNKSLSYALLTDLNKFILKYAI